MEYLVEYVAKGFMAMLLISMHCVLVAAAGGLFVGILQAVPPGREQAIASGPRVVGVFFMVIFLGVFYIYVCHEIL